MNIDSSFNFFLNEEINKTPNRNKNESKIQKGTPSNYNCESLLHSYLNESNGVPIISDITDEGILQTKFDNLENEILHYCIYYKSLKDIFKDSDLTTKNKFVQYLSEFNNRCKTYTNYKTKYQYEAQKNSEVKNKLKEDLNQKNKDFEKIQKKIKAEYEEIKENMQKQIDENRFKLNKANEEIKKLNNSIDKLKQDIIKRDKDILQLRENYADNKNNKTINQPSSPDYFTISYCLGAHTDDNINIDCLKKNKDLDSLKEKCSKAENDFNVIVSFLVETSNKTLEQFKKIYLKLKGEEWMESKSKNKYIKMYNPPIYNINQEISWTNIMNINKTINAIINEIFEMINSTIDCDPAILNKDSCDFLLDYIVGIKRSFFLQKHIQERTVNQDNFENFENNLTEFKKNRENAIRFFTENNNILNDQSNFERFRDELKEDKTEILCVDDYITNFNSIFQQAKNFADKEENEFQKYGKLLNSQNNRNTIDVIDIEMSSSQNKENSNNGI